MRWTRSRAMLVLIFANVMWSGSYTAGKEAMRILSPIEMNTLRFAVASLALGPVLWFGRRAMPITRRDLIPLGGLSLIGFVLNKLIEFGGLNLTTASDTALLIGAESMFTSIMAWLVLRESVRRGAVWGLIIGSLGIYIVIVDGLGLPHMGGGTRLIGDLLVVLALVCEASYSTFGKAALARYPGLLIIASGVVASMLFWIPASIVNVAVAGVPRMTPGAWAGILYLGIPSTAVAYVIWMVALKHVEAASAAPTLYLQPLLGIVLARVLLSERPDLATLVGGCCIILGVAIAGRGASHAEITSTVAAEPLLG